MKYKFNNNDYNINEGMLTSVWGPSLWHTLHTISFNYPTNPTEEDKKNYKLFLKNGDKLLCGALGFVYENKVFIDIFFWDFLFNDYDMNIVRLFFERFFQETTKINVNEAILPLDKHRKKFESFKKHNQTFFRSCEELQSNDRRINELYYHHYLLKVNYKNYYEQKQKSNIC